MQPIVTLRLFWQPKQNAELNGVLKRLYVGLPEEFEQEFKPQQADVLVAEYLAAPLMALAPEFATLLKMRVSSHLLVANRRASC